MKVKGVGNRLDKSTEDMIRRKWSHEEVRKESVDQSKLRKIME